MRTIPAWVAVMVAALALPPAADALAPDEVPVNVDSWLLRLSAPSYLLRGSPATLAGELSVPATVAIGSGDRVGAEVPLAGRPVRLTVDGAVVDEEVSAADGSFAFAPTFPTRGARTLEVETDLGWTSREHEVVVADLPAPAALEVAAALVPWDALRIFWNTTDDGGAPITGRTLRLVDPAGHESSSTWAYPGNHVIEAPGEHTVGLTLRNALGSAPETVVRVTVPTPPPADPLRLGYTITLFSESGSWAQVHDGDTYTTDAPHIWTGSGVEAFLDRGGLPVTGDAVRFFVEWTWPGGSEGAGARTTTWQGRAAASPGYGGTHVYAPPPGECYPVQTLFRATYPGQVVERHGSFTLCRAPE